MKKYIKILCAVLCVVLTASAFFACTGGNSGSDTITVGIIQYASHPSLDNCREGVIKGLQNAGYKDGENIKIDYQNAANSDETANQIAKNMAAKNYDIIISIATPAATAAYSAARGTGVPVIFCAVSDPVAAKLVPSMDKAGDNCTGTSDLLNLEAQLKLIRACQPNAKKIGIIYTTSEANSVSHLEEIKALAPNYGFEIVAKGIQSPADIPQTAAMLAGEVDCINNFTDNNVVNNLGTVLEKANAAGIPVYGSEIEQVKNGCLASESLDYVALGEKTGAMAAKVLSGTDISTMPIEKVKDSFPVINTTVAEKFSISLTGYGNIEKVS